MAIYTKTLFDFFYNNQNITKKQKDKILEYLLKDMTSGMNIIWATSDYSELGDGYEACDELTPYSLYGERILRRSVKTKLNQVNRTRERAEVFTPSWICNMQNNLIDEQWFGRPNVFNQSEGEVWKTVKGNIPFNTEQNKSWQDYVKAPRLEVSCGEAPYLVSRYDSVTGAPINVDDRIGLLDRKLRIVNENVDDENEWFKWVTYAFQSTYAYEYQGDNLFLARENLLLTFIDNMEYKFKRIPNWKQLRKISEIISWNIWQMDALTCEIPFHISSRQLEQLCFFGEMSTTKIEQKSKLCKIKDWYTKNNKKRIIEYKSLLKGETNG